MSGVKRNFTESETDQDLVLGIDLGTTNSVVSVFDKTGVVIPIVHEDGRRTVPSCVTFVNATDRVVGQAAKNDTGNVDTVYNVKRLIGKTYDECLEMEMFHNLSYSVVSGEDRNPKIRIPLEDGSHGTFTPEEVCAVVLSKLKESARVYLQCNVTKAMITVPAYFTDAQREATKQAGQIAGLDVLRVINEPTAAAVAFGYQGGKNFLKEGETKNIIVYDLGGGTFDLTVLTVKKAKSTGNTVYTVITTDGNSSLGGLDVDTALVDHFVETIKRESEVDIRPLRVVMKRLREACETLKITLSTSNKHYFAFLDMSTDVSIQFATYFTRQDLDRICSPLINKTMDCVERACARAAKEAGITKYDHILLVGGSTRIPAVQKRLEEFFKRKVEPVGTVNPDESVSYGAAVCGVVVNFDENGSSAHAAKKVGIRVNDVTPLPIGVQAYKDGSTDFMAVIVPQNTLLPCSREKVFTTVKDWQTSIIFKVYEGFYERASQNTLLGIFTICDLPSAERGGIAVVVRMNIDCSSILTATALDKTSGKQVSLLIDKKAKLTAEQVMQMKVTPSSARNAQITAEEEKKTVSQREEGGRATQKGEVVNRAKRAKFTEV